MQKRRFFFPGTSILCLFRGAAGSLTVREVSQRPRIDSLNSGSCREVGALAAPGGSRTLSEGELCNWKVAAIWYQNPRRHHPLLCPWVRHLTLHNNCSTGARAWKSPALTSPTCVFQGQSRSKHFHWTLCTMGNILTSRILCCYINFFTLKLMIFTHWFLKNITFINGTWA